MMDGTRLSCLKNERRTRTKPFPNQMMMQSADGQQIRHPDAIRSDFSIRNNQDLATMLDGVDRAFPKLGNSRS